MLNPSVNRSKDPYFHIGSLSRLKLSNQNISIFNFGYLHYNANENKVYSNAEGISFYDANLKMIGMIVNKDYRNAKLLYQQRDNLYLELERLINGKIINGIWVIDGFYSYY